jgi:hypothetical protein
LFDKTEDAQRAVAVLGDRRAREFAETLIIAGAPVKVVAAALRRVLPGVTEKSACLFERYFFDLAHLTRGDLRVLLALRADRDIEAAASEGAAAAAAVRRRWRFDPRQLAVDLPQGGPFAQLGLLAAGFDIPTRDPAALLRRIRDRAVLRATERVHRHSRRDAHTALALVELASKATDLIERVQDPQSRLLEDFRRAVLTTSDKRVPSIHELSPTGQFTTDLAQVDSEESGSST